MAFDEQKIQDWIQAKKPKSPICNQEHWKPQPQPLGLFKQASPSFGNRQGLSFDLFVALSCDNCGYTMLVTSQAMGITTDHGHFSL